MLCFEKLVLFLDENLKAIIAFQTSNKILSDYDPFRGTICVLPK